LSKYKNHINIHNHLTKSELIDYSNGVLGNQEMYRLELHLNECELCSDAVDGLEEAANFEAAINKINATILPKSRSAFAPTYINIAASIALIVVFGLSYWFITKPEINETIALNTPIKISEESNDPLFNKEPDSIVVIDNNQNEEIAIEPEAIEADEEVIKIATTQANNEVKFEASSKQKSIIRQKEIEQSEPTLAVADDETVALEEVISGPTDSNIILSETVQPIQGAARAEKKASAAPPTTLKDQKEPSPIGGMAALKSYLEQNLVYPQQAIDNNIKGTVVLIVSINSDGSINSIEVSKGLGFGCDAEAMRLISTGPKWTPKVENGKAKRANTQVKVKFKKQ